MALAKRPEDSIFDEEILTPKREAIDIVYQANFSQGKRITYYLELRNLLVGESAGSGFYSSDFALPEDVAKITDWHERAKQFQSWNQKDLGSVKLAPLPSTAPQWKRNRWASTVKQYLDLAVNEVKTKYETHVRKRHARGEEFHVWVLVRVGIGHVVAQNCETLHAVSV